jgi:DNA-binding NarL/FixJ family response regulator
VSKVLIVDDHALIRSNLRSFLNGYPSIDVCGEATDGKEAVDKAGELRPDIVLLDIKMPRMNGLEAAKEIHRLLPSTKIVFLTAHPQSVFEGSRSWSNGFVNKLAAETELIPTLDHLLQGNAQGLNGPLRYQWQHAVMDAFASAPDSLAVKIERAEHAMAVRFTDLNPPDREEQSALNEALLALRHLASERPHSRSSPV